MFNVYTRITKTDSLLSTITEQTTAVQKIIEDILRIHMKRQVKDASNTQNRLSTIKIYNRPMNCFILLYKKSKSCTSLYKLLRLEEKCAIVRLLSGPTKFQTTVIRPYYQKVQKKEKEENKKNFDSPSSYNDDKKTSNC